MRSRRLMDLIFREYQSYEFFKQGQPVDQANVWLGTAPQVDLILDEPLKMVLSRKDRQAMEISVQWLDPVPAPIRAGDQIGTMVVSLPDELKNCHYVRPKMLTRLACLTVSARRSNI